MLMSLAYVNGELACDETLSCMRSIVDRLQEAAAMYGKRIEAAELALP